VVRMQPSGTDGDMVDRLLRSGKPPVWQRHSFLTDLRLAPGGAAASVRTWPTSPSSTSAGTRRASFGQGCAGPAGAPVIAAKGVPMLGNSGFGVRLQGAEDLRLCCTVLGLAPRQAGTVDLSAVLGPGCVLQVDWFRTNFRVTLGGRDPGWQCPAADAGAEHAGAVGLPRLRAVAGGGHRGCRHLGAGPQHPLGQADVADLRQSLRENACGRSAASPGPCSPP
jgi:hypothetical protein